ncbi:hypothetical protein PINS_up001316 [Pythium insidiosum]|nr:hypothetical protein PINS_up001316 [Pythium insidiosum]
MESYRVRKRNLRSEGSGDELAMHACLSDAVMRRFLLRAGFTTATDRMIDHTRRYFCQFVKKLTDAILIRMEHQRRFTVLLSDVLDSCRQYGIRVYGYDDEMIVLDKYQPIHVTEMIDGNFIWSHQDQNEPEDEPGDLYKRVNFVENVEAFGSDDEDDWYSDDSEWSWYSDSDESDDDEQDADQDSNAAQPHRWTKTENPRERLLASLAAAQEVVDNHLLFSEQTSADPVNDAPQGQGYFSDCDDDREPECLRDWEDEVNAEEDCWKVIEGRHEYQERDVDDVSDDEMEDVTEPADPNNGVQSEESNEYIIARHVFLKLYHGGFVWSGIRTTAVALSALHNVSEQHLQSALTSGSLQSQLTSMLMEDRLAQAVQAEEELRAEKEKSRQAEMVMAQMQATFKSKEIDMQNQIADLQRQLRYHQESGGNPSHDEPTTNIRKSPGKRKSVDKDQSEQEHHGHRATSLVTTLRARLHDYSLRKKARINPV